MKELKHLNKYFLKYKWHLILGTFITILARLFTLVTPMLIGESTTAIEKYVTGVTNDRSALESELITNILLLLGATLIAAIFTFIMRQTFIVVSRHIEYDLKNEIYREYQDLSLNFYKKNRTGDLMNRISEDVSRVRMYIGPAIMYSVQTGILFIVVIPYMFIKAPELTLYAVTPL